jgi:hypothetical protein
MALLRPFRALRADPARIDPGALVVHEPVADAEVVDARNLRRVLRDDAVPAVAEPRARFFLGELVRAGLLRRDDAPALYAMRVVRGDESCVGFFAAALLEGLAVGAQPVDERSVHAGVIGDAAIVSYTDKKGRVTRSLETEMDRNPDASFRLGDRIFELWVVNEETVAERVTALVEGGKPRITAGESVLAALQARQRRDSASVTKDETARGLGLAFCVDDESVVPALPAGIVLLPFFDRGMTTLVG